MWNKHGEFTCTFLFAEAQAELGILIRKKRKRIRRYLAPHPGTNGGKVPGV